MSADLPPQRPTYGRSAEQRSGGSEWLAPATTDPPTRRTLADSLEPGTLRDELGGAPVSQGERVLPDRVVYFDFTGDGAEYFRIWVVNLLLTLLTLGAYSAWAKVRKTRYFWQNTRLDGHVFDYHGSPRAILLGRVIALLLLVGYSVSVEISRTAALAMIIVLCVAGPWLFMRAQRFKLVNTSWRGLRFGFDTRAWPAYRAVLPPLLIWFSSAIIGALANDRVGLFAAAGLVSGIMLPWMHHRLKAYQHGHASFGDRHFGFLSATPGFYATYFKAGLLAAAAAVLGAMTFVGVVAWMAQSGRDPPGFLMMAAGAGAGLVGWLVAWPYFAARLQAIVWSHTTLGDVRFSTAIAAWPLLRLTVTNVVLTLATAGLYWPFASIALTRYRVECMRAESDEPLAAVAAATASPDGFAAGDAAADVFGLDIGI